MILKMEQKTKYSGKAKANYEVILKMKQKNKHVTTEDRTTEITDTKNSAKGIKYDGEDGGGGGGLFIQPTPLSFLFSFSL